MLEGLALLSIEMDMPAQGAAACFVPATWCERSSRRAFRIPHHLSLGGQNSRASYSG